MTIARELLFALKDTVYMVVLSTIFSIAIGFIPAVILILTNKDGLRPNKVIYGTLDFIINILRSFPFIVLMVAIFPITKFIVGKQIGIDAAIVPLTIAAAPFVTRVIESSLKEVDKGIIEAAKSFGASDIQIIFNIMLVESMPSIVSGLTLTIINIVGYSAMAGAIGAGGLGDIAIKYGLYRFQTDIMIYTVIVLIILVQLLQLVGNLIYKRIS